MCQSIFSQTDFMNIRMRESAADFLVVSAEEQAILNNIPGWQVQNNEDVIVTQSQHLQPVQRSSVQQLQQLSLQPLVQQQPSLQSSRQSNLQQSSLQSLQQTNLQQPSLQLPQQSNIQQPSLQPPQRSNLQQPSLQPPQQSNLQQPSLQQPQQSNLPQLAVQKSVPQTIAQLLQQPIVPCQLNNYLQLPVTKHPLALKRSRSLSDFSDNAYYKPLLGHLDCQQSIINCPPPPVKQVNSENTGNSPSSKKSRSVSAPVTDINDQTLLKSHALNTQKQAVNEDTVSIPNSNIPNATSERVITSNCTDLFNGQRSSAIMPIVNEQPIVQNIVSDQQLPNIEPVKKSNVVSDSHVPNTTYVVENHISDSNAHQHEDTEPFAYVMGEETQKACLEMTSNGFFTNSPCSSRMTKSQECELSQNNANISTKNPTIIHLTVQSAENPQEEEGENVLSSSIELFPLEQDLKVPKRSDVIRVKRRLQFSEEMPNMNNPNEDQLLKTPSNPRLSPIIDVIRNNNNRVSPLLLSAEKFNQPSPPRTEVAKPAEKLFNFTPNDIKEMLSIIWDIYS